MYIQCVYKSRSVFSFQCPAVIFVHGFAKNEKLSLSDKELIAFKELANILLSLSSEDLDIAVNNGALIEVRS